MSGVWATYEQFMQPDLLILRYGELWLKGANRTDFVQALATRLRVGLKTVAPDTELVVRHDRMEIRLGQGMYPAALDLARRTPGIVRIACAYRVERDVEAMKAKAVKVVDATLSSPPYFNQPTPTFRVACRRTDKRFEITSPDVSQRVAKAILSRHPMTVDLRQATLTLGCEIAAHGTFVWTEDYTGCGGLPVGSAGKTLLLLSGGIDSPVAGHLAQRRGCELESVYFHSPPFVPQETLDKVKELGSALALVQGTMLLHSVYFTSIQKAIKAHCESQHTVLLYRRFMYRIAERLATQRKCQALVTGENLGQVASQTIENLNVVDRLTNRVVMRPLLTYDKTQVMDIARSLGTYEISIRPFDDCCTLFVPRNPTTRGKPYILEHQERRLDVDELVAEALERTECFELSFR